MEPTNAAVDGSSRGGVPVRFLGPSPQEDKRNRGRERIICAARTHREGKRRARERKKSLCLPVGEGESRRLSSEAEASRLAEI